MKYNGYVEQSGKKACQIKGGSRELTAQLLSTVPPTSYLRHQGLSLMPAEVLEKEMALVQQSRCCRRCQVR